MTAFYSHHERHPADTTTCHRRPCDGRDSLTTRGGALSPGIDPKDFFS